MARKDDLFNLGGKNSKGNSNDINYNALEDENETDFLKGFEELDEDSREVDFKKVSKQEFAKAMEDTSPERIKKAMKNAIPPKFRVEYEELEEFTSNIKSAVDKNFGGLKKDVADLAHNIARLAPEGKFKNWMEKRFSKHSEDFKKASENRDAAIQQEISNIFAATEASRREQEAINNALADKRSKREEALQTLMAKDIRALKAYTFEQGVNYQKKSLELKFKHYAVAKDHYELAKATNIEMLKQLNSIAKNTSLPDLLKQRQVEMLGGDLKARFRANLIERNLGEKSFIGRLQKSAIDKINAYGEVIKDKIQSTKDLSDDAITAREDLKEMAEMAGGEKALKAQMAGKAGAGIFDFILSKTILRSAMNKASKSKLGKKAVAGLRNLMLDPSQPVRDLADRMLTSDNGFVNYAGEFVSEIGDTLNVKNRQPLANLKRESLDGSSTFDFRTKVNVNKVIPGYLRMILAETYANRIKLDPSKSSKELEVHFDYSSENFLTQSMTQAAIIKRFKEETKKSTTFGRYRLEHLLGKGLDNKGLGVTEKDKRDLANAIMIASQTSGKNGIAILKDKEFQKLLPGHLKKKLGHIQKSLATEAMNDDYFHNDFVDGVNNIRRSVPSFNAYIEQLFKSNDISLLKNLGLVIYDPNIDEYRADPNGIRRLMYKQFGLELGSVDPKKSREAEFIDRVARKTALGVKIGKKKAKKAGKAAMDKVNEYRQDPDSMLRDMKAAGGSVSNFAKDTYNKGKEAFNNIKDKYNGPPLRPEQVDTLKRLADNGIIRAEEILKTAGIDYDATDAKISKAEREYNKEKAREAIQRTKDVATALDAIDKAKMTNDMNVLNEAVDSIQTLGQDVAGNAEVQKAVGNARRYINQNIKTANEAMAIIKKEKDPNKALKRFADMKETISKFLPSSSSSNILIRGMSLYVGTLWKLEKWLWKNVYGKVAKGAIKGVGAAAKLPFKALGFLGSTAMQLPRILPRDYFRTIAAAPFRLAGGIGGYMLGGLGRRMGKLFGFGKGKKKGKKGFFSRFGRRGSGDEWVDPRDRSMFGFNKPKPKYINGRLEGEEYGNGEEKKSNPILEFLKSWGSKLLLLLGPLAAFFTKFSVGGLSKLIGLAFKGAMKFIAPGIMKLFKGGFSLLKSVLGFGGKGILKGAKALGGAALGGLKKLGGMAVDLGAGLWSGAKNLAKSAAGAVMKGASAIADVTKRFIMEGWTKCKQLYSFVTEDLYKKVVTGAKGAFDKVKKQIPKVIKSPKIVGKVIARLTAKMGGLLVPGLGLALLAWDIGNVIYYMIKEKKDLGSALCLQFLGFDPWDEETEVKLPDDVLNPDEQAELAKEQSEKNNESVASGKATETKEETKKEPATKPKVTKTGDLREDPKTDKKKLTESRAELKERYFKLLDKYGKDMDLSSEEIETLKSYAEMKSKFDPNFQDNERMNKGLGVNVGAFSSSYEVLGSAADLLGKDKDPGDPEIQTVAAILDYKRKKSKILEMTQGNKPTLEDIDKLLGIDTVSTKQVYTQRLKEIEEENKRKKEESDKKTTATTAANDQNAKAINAVAKGVDAGNKISSEGMENQAALTTDTNKAIGQSNELLSKIVELLEAQQQEAKETKEALQNNKNSGTNFSRAADSGIPLR